MLNLIILMNQQGKNFFSDERTGKVGEDLHYDTRKKISEFKGMAMYWLKMVI